MLINCYRGQFRKNSTQLLDLMIFILLQFITTGIACLITAYRRTKKWVSNYRPSHYFSNIYLSANFLCHFLILCDFQICCIMVMSVLSCLFCALLFGISCMGLRYADSSGRYLSTCEVEEFKGLSSRTRRRKNCKGVRTLS